MIVMAFTNSIGDDHLCTTFDIPIVFVVVHPFRSLKIATDGPKH